MSVHVHTLGCIHAVHTCICEGKHILDVFPLPLFIVLLEIGSLTKPSAHQLQSKRQQKRSRPPWVLLMHESFCTTMAIGTNVIGLACQQVLGILLSPLFTASIIPMHPRVCLHTGDLNSGPHSWATGALHTEPHLPDLIPTTF